MSILNVAEVVTSTEAEGPGRRFALWVQGCPMRCAGCCNPAMLPFAGGTAMPTRELAARIVAHAATDELEGLSLLGGEPFAQAAACAEVAKAARDVGLSVMVFTGFTRAELESECARGDSAVAALLAVTDLLVDGRYEQGRPDHARRWIGSTNQTLHFLSNRYSPDDPAFVADNTIELRLRGGSLVVNGWPATANAVLRSWRRR